VRPRSDGAVTAVTGFVPSSPQVTAPYHPEDGASHRRRRSGWFRTHLMMKAGVALVLVGLLLVKFG
jgi:hypothetical protein